MKKIISAFLVLTCLCFSIVVVHSEPFDLSELSDEEIVELFSQVQNELVERNIQKSATMSEGFYIVGEDMPAGKYIFTCTCSAKYGAYLYVFENSDMLAEEEYKMCYSFQPKDENGNTGEYSIYLNLTEGNVVFIKDITATLTISSGLMFQ